MGKKKRARIQAFALEEALVRASRIRGFEVRGESLIELVLNREGSPRLRPDIQAKLVELATAEASADAAAN